MDALLNPSVLGVIGIVGTVLIGIGWFVKKMFFKTRQEKKDKNRKKNEKLRDKLKGKGRPKW